VNVATWGLLTNHARVLLCIAQDPEVRLRDIAASAGITERTAYGIVSDLVQAGCLVKYKDGRRSQYEIQAHLPVPDGPASPGGGVPTLGEFLALLAGLPPAATRAHPAGGYAGGGARPGTAPGRT
jgi:IclR helix-turn-helix domain